MQGDNIFEGKPYGPDLLRSTSPLQKGTNSGIGDSKSGPAPDGSVSPITSESPYGDRAVDYSEMWIGAWLKSRNYRPREVGFFLDAYKGTGEFAKLTVGRRGIEIIQTETGVNSSNAILIRNAADYAAIDILKTGIGNAIYIQSDAGSAIEILQTTDTPGLKVTGTGIQPGSGGVIEGIADPGTGNSSAPAILGRVASGSGDAIYGTVESGADGGVPSHLEQNKATNTNFYEMEILENGAGLEVRRFISTSSNPDGVVSAPKSSLCASGGNLYINTDGATAWSAFAKISSIVDVQTFTADGTWTKPANVSSVMAIVTGAGGGGGGGRGNGSAAHGLGGSGGGAGNRVKMTFKASDLGATETVVVGVGGTGGTYNTNGTAGGFSYFSTLVAYGGGGGSAGLAVGNDNSGGGGAGTGSAGSNGSTADVTGGVPATTAGANGIAGQGGGGTVSSGNNNAENGGGGGGGTDNATLTPHDGGSSLFSAGGGGAGGSTSTTDGADGGRFGAYTAGGGGAGGTGGASPTNGTAGTNGDSTKAGYGGGGGGGTSTNTVNGANGGNGGTSGGGGGGGGASYGAGGGNGGTGGDGGRGEVIVISW